MNSQSTLAPNKTRKKVALFLLIGPFALLVMTIFFYGIMNLLVGSSSDSGAVSFIAAIINVFFYLTGIVSILALLPGIIIGIVLLNKK